jgi:hypothetical protein
VMMPLTRSTQIYRSLRRWFSCRSGGALSSQQHLYPLYLFRKFKAELRTFVFIWEPAGKMWKLDAPVIKRVGVPDQFWAVAPRLGNQLKAILPDFIRIEQRFVLPSPFAEIKTELLFAHICQTTVGLSYQR